MTIQARDMVRLTESVVSSMRTRQKPSEGCTPFPREPGFAQGLSRRREIRRTDRQLCSYAACEPLSGDGQDVVIQEGEVFALNRSAHGILLLMGYAPRFSQLLEVHLRRSAWRSAVNLFDVRWTQRVPVEDQGEMYLVGCRLSFGPRPYWIF